jgi:hypothetical protein
MFSYENRSLPALRMGVETSLPLFAMDAAAPKGAPRRPQLPDFLETVLAPPCPARGPEAGRPHKKCHYFLTIFMVRMRTPVHARFYRAKKLLSHVLSYVN